MFHLIISKLRQYFNTWTYVKLIFKCQRLEPEMINLRVVRSWFIIWAWSSHVSDLAPWKYVFQKSDMKIHIKYVYLVTYLFCHGTKIPATLEARVFSPIDPSCKNECGGQTNSCPGLRRSDFPSILGQPIFYPKRARLRTDFSANDWDPARQTCLVIGRVETWQLRHV